MDRLSKVWEIVQSFMFLGKNMTKKYWICIKKLSKDEQYLVNKDKTVKMLTRKL